MSSHTWTLDEVSSSFVAVEREVWRTVEAQHVASTMKLTDTAQAQALLERLIETTKPNVPAECEALHFLLAAPFRYKPYPEGSRFRRAGITPGVFYCSEDPSTSIAELAFYRVLFFAESPATPWPANAAEYTSFAATVATTKGIDLSKAPFDATTSDWEARSNYGACQDMADLCRRSGGEAIRYMSVRDPGHGFNLALLTCRVFAEKQPTRLESWKMHLGPGGVRAVREFPHQALTFDRTAFASDPRVSALSWTR